MKHMVYIIIAISALLVIGAIILFYISKYNQIQFNITKIEKAEGLIDEALRNRYDLINKMIKIIKNKVKSTKEYFKDFDKLKDQEISNFELDRKLTEFYTLCETVSSDYKSLNDNKDLKVLFKELKQNEEKLMATKNYYNKNTNDLNGMIRKFPINIIAKIHKVKIKPFFDGKDLTDDIIDDFKL